MLRRQAPALGRVDRGAGGDAQQRVVRLVEIGGVEINVVGRDQRQVERVGQIDQRILDPIFLGEPVTLQLDIEPAREQSGQLFEQRLRHLLAPACEQPANRTRGTAGETD